MWDKLSIIHEQKSTSNKLGMLQKFHEYRMSPGDSMIKHISAVHNMAAQLLDVNEKVSQTMIMAKLLGSLSSKYGTLQTAWESVDPEKQKMEHLVERLLREETRLANEEEAPGAFAAFKRNNSKKASESSEKEKKNKYRCFKCGEKGHFARE